MLVKIIELIFIACTMLFLVTQIIIPVLQNRTMFPSFRKTGKLESELVDAHQEMYDVQLSQEVEAVRKEVVDIKDNTISTPGEAAVPASVTAKKPRTKSKPRTKKI